MPETCEFHKAHFDRAVDWYNDVLPSSGNHNDDYSHEKLYDVETMARWELDWRVAHLAKSKPQPIWFHRGMNMDFTPRSFGLLYYLRQHDTRKCHRFIFACKLVGETAEARESMQAKVQAHAENTVENFLVNYPDRQVVQPQDMTMTFFATQMGSDHQERILLEYMAWRRREPENTTHLISTAHIVSHQRSKERTDWYAHLPVPLPAPADTATLNAVIGFHEHEGRFYYAAMALNGRLLALGDVELPTCVRPRHGERMTNDNFAFETANHILRHSITDDYYHRVPDHHERYTAYIGIEDTGWKHDLVGTEAADNRQNVSLPRQRMFEIVCYKAVRHGLPLPHHVKHIAPTRDCGRCGERIDQSGVQKRAVTHCFHCKTLGIHHTLIPIQSASGQDCYECDVCKRIWQKEAPQFKCRHCRYQQYAHYNTALVAVHRTVDSLVGRPFRHPEA